MAAALAFRTLFGLIPVLFVATLVTRSLLGDGFPRFVRSLGELAGLDRLHAPAIAGSTEAPPALSAWIEELVSITGTLNLSALGAVGVAVVIVSALWLVVSIEETFNTVCRVPNSRSWSRRLLVYWSALTLGPAILASIPFVSAEVRALFAGVETAQEAYRFFEPVFGFALLWGLLIFAYGVIPAERIRWSAILIGALVGAVGLEIGRKGLGLYLEKAFTVNRLYGSLGFVPLFMFWVYAMWLIVLFGLQVAALLNILMNRESRRTALDPPTAPFDPALAVAAMEWLAQRFVRGEPCHLGGLADTLAIDKAVAARLVAQLAKADFVVAGREDGLLLPARALDAIAVESVLHIGQAMANQGRNGSCGGIVGRLRSAQLACVEGLNFGSPTPTDELHSRSFETSRPT